MNFSVRTARAWASRVLDRLGRALDGPTPDRTDAFVALAVAAVALALACTQVFRRHALPLLNDEFAYQLQARTLLQGRIALPPPPLPEFFEAPHILVVPTYAGKYFPGHAAVLAPFAAAGVEWLPTCLELAAASAVLYVLLRRAGLVRAGAVFACAVHQLSGRNLLMATTLLSHGTSTLLALASLLVIPRIDAPDAYAPTMTASALTGFSLLTRPYSAIAAFPLIALRLLRVRPRPGTVLAAAGPLLLAVALLAGFDKAVTGSITTTPWSRWARQYTPYDGPGFGTPSTAAPERPLPAHFAYLGRLYWSSRKAYTVAALPHIASQRLRDLIGLLPSAPLFLLTCVGALACWRRRRLGAIVAFAATLFMLNLTFHASAPQYFIDIYPAVAALCGVGFAASLALLRTCTDPQTNRDAQLFAAVACVAALASYLPLFDGGIASAAVLVIVTALALATWGMSGARRYPVGRILVSVLLAGALVRAVPETFCSLRTLRAPAPGAYAGSLEAKLAANVPRYAEFERARARVAALHGILFVKYRLTGGDFTEFPIINPTLGTGKDLPLVVAVDLGPRDRELLAAYPGRPGFIFDAERLSLTDIDATAARGELQ